MDTMEFFGMVLPGTGRYCAAYIDRNGPKNPRTLKPFVNHKWFDTIQELAEFYERVEKRNKAGKQVDCYHATGTFNDKERRKQEHVVACRSLFFDLDCGFDEKGRPKAFTDQRAAVAALSRFVDGQGLPIPMVVSSGNGIHAYWPFDRDLTPAEWQPLADAIKALAQNAGLQIDAACTADSARILRTPGTTNHKGGRTRAEVLYEGDGPFTPESMASLLSVAPAPQKPASKSNGKVPPKRDDFFGDLRGELPKADHRVIEAECQQVRGAMADPAGVDEPLWYRLVGLAAFTTGEEKVAQRWSKGHPEYDRKATLLKYNQWTMNTRGPPLCTSFAGVNPAGCKGCVYRDKIKTPVQIVPAPVSEAVLGMPVPPKPFFLKGGQIFKHTTKVEGGNTVPVDELVYPSTLYPARYYRDPDADVDMAEWHWEDAQGIMRTTVMTAALSTGNNREYRGHMANARIASLDDATAPLLKEYMTAAYDDMLTRQPADAAVRSLGWQEKFASFALGHTLYTSNGIHPAQLGGGVVRAAEGYGVAGTMDEWLRMTRILGRHDMFPQQIAIGIGMASILMPFTGLNGAVISYYGPSGTGKTTAENMQQAVWGDPKLLVRGAKATANALYGTFAAMGNMPVALDEASKTVAGNIGELLYSISVGAEKDRMDSNAIVKARRTWCLLALLSGNQSFAAQLATTGGVSDAQQRRLLEMEVLPNPALTASMAMGKKLQQLAYTNHGHVGVKWVEFLLPQGEDSIREMIDQAEQALIAMGYSASGEDRFHTTVAALIYLSLTVAKEAGWVSFDPAGAIQWMLDQLTSQRDQQEETTDDHFDLINLFCNQKIASTVSLIKTTDKSANDAYAETPRAIFTEGVVVRVERWRAVKTAKPAGGRLYISRDALSRWLQERGTDIGTVLAGLKRDGALLSTDKRIRIASGMPLSAAQVRCIMLRLDHPRMELDPPATKLTLVTDRQADPA